MRSWTGVKYAEGVHLSNLGEQTKRSGVSEPHSRY